MKITNVFARQILDSRGNPTVETDVIIDNKYLGRAAVPSGASTGSHEALELRDGDQEKFYGEGVLTAVNNIETTIAKRIIGLDAIDQSEFDKILIDLDGTENKSNLGANSILAVSLAFAWAKSNATEVQLFEYIGGLYGNKNFILPRPMFNIMNGGKHANWATDIQEYMVIPIDSKSWTDSLETGSEIFHSLEKLLIDNNYSTNVGNEGGFAPLVRNNEEALQLIVRAVANAGCVLGENVKLGFDAAASEFYNPITGNYELKKDKRILTKDEMVDFAVSLSKRFPVASFEDMLAQDDWASWTKLTNLIGKEIQIVGDDLLVTNVKRIQEAIDKKACNSLLVKVNQIGSLSEALASMKLAQSAGWNNVVSHRSGETDDVTIAHLAVGTGCGQIKSGAPSRGERTAKYNELIRIEEYLKNKQ